MADQDTNTSSGSGSDERSDRRDGGSGGRYQNRRRPGGGRGFRGRRRRKVCMFCADKVTSIDYKDVGLLKQYLSRSARIRSRRKSGTCAKHQRMLARAVKRARQIALLPYTSDHIQHLTKD